jgi:elongation factor P--beta-lysine ligase
MGRPSIKAIVTDKVNQYICQAREPSAEKMPLTTLAVAKAIKHDRRVLKKYALDVTIANAAAELRKHVRQRRRTMDERIAAANARSEAFQRQVNALLGHVALMEGNAKRLGIDPDELYVPLTPPDRSKPATRKKRRVRL